MKEFYADGRADCLFFMNSSCNKGNLCIYRHSIAARESRVQCKEFQQRQTCTKIGCGDRHLTSYISGTYCYWETTPTGCTKAICPFKHHDQPGSGKQFLLSNFQNDILESQKNTTVDSNFSEKAELNISSSEIKQNDEKQLDVSQFPVIMESEKKKSLFNEDEVDKRKRKPESVLLAPTHPKKQEKSPLKENIKITSQALQNSAASTLIPTGPKAQRNIFQQKTSLKNSKTNNSRKQEKRGLSTAHEKDNVEFRVRTLEEIREEKAARFKLMEKSKELASEDKIQTKEFSNITRNNLIDNSRSDTDEKVQNIKCTDQAKIEIHSEIFSFQKNTIKSEDQLTDDIKNNLNSNLLLSDDDLEFLNDNENNVIDIIHENNGFEDDELAAFERELKM
ncbi:hypothetical protein PNEG_00552 [Pneumocystis murina B123]|uniref:C3H1-type domain-containing protein n=1 Tax=Pneumocystis murina (strain B123) TaxID=1069680 RepID=M7PM46_PNEMU|nr:hypothetical protein PNEG_00552 [Pneumocystis murina B123]EMR11544.1 hypothetical protein PNEG_00552 [Pneumocystis murina B123]